jgi:hypothetical protein
VRRVRRPTKSTTERGYGAEHQKERQRWKAVVDAGRAVCARCHRPILPGQAWDLDHNWDRTGYLGPSHARCNRGAPKNYKQARLQAKVRQILRRTSRDW